MTKLVAQLNNCEYEYEISHKFDRQYCLVCGLSLLYYYLFLVIWYRYIEIRVDEHKCLCQKTYVLREFALINALVTYHTLYARLAI